MGEPRAWPRRPRDRSAGRVGLLAHLARRAVAESWSRPGVRWPLHGRSGRRGNPVTARRLLGL